MTGSAIQNPFKPTAGKNPPELIGTGEVASAMGKRPTSLSPVRQRLIDEGLIESPAYGKVAFAIPNLGAYLRVNRDRLLA